MCFQILYITVNFKNSFKLSRHSSVAFGTRRIFLRDPCRHQVPLMRWQHLAFRLVSEGCWVRCAQMFPETNLDFLDDSASELLALAAAAAAALAAAAATATAGPSFPLVCCPPLLPSSSCLSITISLSFCTSCLVHVRILSCTNIQVEQRGFSLV